MSPPSRPADAPDVRAARLWLGLAVGVLVVAGLFALAVVVGRMPPFDRFVTDPLFFKRCLVAHVNMALFAWFYAFVAALFSLLPGRGANGRVARLSPLVAGAGVVLMLLGAGTPGSPPILANYVPTIDHGLFHAGQLLFAAGVLGSLLRGGLLFGREAAGGGLHVPPEAQALLRGAAWGLVLAALTFAGAWLHMPPDLEREVFFELLVWGAGHVLQLVSVLAMLAVWLMLLTPVLGSSPVSRRAAGWLAIAMLLPWTLAPLLPLQGLWSAAYQAGFTRLMQWGIAPGVASFLVLCALALRRARRERRLPTRALWDPRVCAFLVSASLTVLGFALGAAIRGSTTVVPAHYHASVGAVTASFMAATFVMLETVRLSLPGSRLQRAAAWQPLVYGSGMLLFAAGFALAGAHGMGRKVYGAEQASRGFAETVGLGIMGVGGLVAVVGGLLFLGVIGAAWWHGFVTTQPSQLAVGGWRWRHGVRKTG